MPPQLLYFIGSLRGGRPAYIYSSTRLLRLLLLVFLSCASLPSSIPGCKCSRPRLSGTSYRIPFFWIIASISLQRTGGWFIIVIILERIVAVWFPFNLRNISTITRAKCITAFIFVVTLTAYITTGAVVLISSINGEIPPAGPVSTKREGARYLTTRSEA